MTREEWLGAAKDRLLVLIAERTALPAPGRIQVSCGFPRGDRNGAVIGQCFVRSCGKGVSQLFISPTLTAPIKVLATLLHELIHACDDCDSGHKGAYLRAWRALGFAGKPTTSDVKRGSELYETLRSLSADLGPYPHKGLQPGYRMTKKQGTRMVKCSCDDCGYTVRTTRKWLEVAVPFCPNPECEATGLSLTVEEKEEPE